MAKLIECKRSEFVTRADLERAPKEQSADPRGQNSASDSASIDDDDYTIDERWYAMTTRKRNVRSGK